jgi:acyl-CoA thioesterase II
LPRELGFGELLTLEPRGADRFVGRSPAYPWDGVYGGQLVAQALRAAGETVDARFLPHSLHTRYVRAGRHDEEIVYEVARTHDGRAFATRSVVARQAAGIVATVSAGFHAGERPTDQPAGELPAAEPNLANQTVRAPTVPAPDELAPGGWSSLFDCRFVPPNGHPGRVAAWLRLHDAVHDDAMLAACALAFLSDDVPGDAVLGLLFPDRPPARNWESVDHSLFNHSLDHGVWLSRAVPAGGWQLQEFACHGFAGGRGLVVGHVFDADGAQLATVTQEVLVRRRRRS